MGATINWKLLTRYVSGECSEQELKRVGQWLEEDPVRRERLRRLQQTWEIADLQADEWDEETAWQQLRVRIRRDEGTGSSSVPEVGCSARSATGTRHRRRRYLLRTAAVLLGAATTALIAVMLNTTGSQDAMPTQKTFVTERGQRGTIELTDGTQVKLNVNSKLTLAKTFETGKRQVQLQGEAYFQVARDTARAFIVHTGDARIQVLGTAFNVQAYPGQDLGIVVTDGEVGLKIARPEAPDTVVLKRGHRAVQSGSRIRVTRRDVDLRRHVAWTENKLFFENARFSTVVQQLERWYDLQIKVDGSIDAIVELNATFEQEPVGEVLDNIAMALDLRYSKEGREVVFYRSNTSGLRHPPPSTTRER